MNKWTVIIVGALVFLGVVHFVEGLKFEEEKPYEDWDYMKPYILPHRWIDASNLTFINTTNS